MLRVSRRTGMRRVDPVVGRPVRWEPPELGPDLMLSARVVVVGSKPFVEGISMNPHRLGRFGLVPLILFQSRHDELAFKLAYGLVVP